MPPRTISRSRKAGWWPKTAFAGPLLDILQQIDLLVAVSPGVADSYRQAGRYSGRSVVLPNGCDFEFWKASGAAHAQRSSTSDKIALFQGGINARLDYDLLSDLARSRPDWRFWFCGSARDGGAGWAKLTKHQNVRHFGELKLSAIAGLAAQALVGLIPFRQDKLIRNSLPLKAWEYVACGLPVVTVPIDALAACPEYFHAETTAAGFAAALDEVAPRSEQHGALARRLAAAERQSYDHRFADLCGALDEALKARKRETAAQFTAVIR